MSAESVLSLLIAILSLVAFALFCGAVWSFLKMRIFLRHAVKTEGVVSGLAQGRNSDGGATYLPIVTFSTACNRQYQITGKTGANPPDYRIGDKTIVCFLPKRPQEARIYSFLDIYSNVVVFLVFSGATFI